MSDQMKGLRLTSDPAAEAGGDPAKVAPQAHRLEAASRDPTVRLFEEAVRQHSRRLLAIARGVVGTRFSPEDVVQQALMNLFKHRDRYDWNQPGPLLRRAVVNESLRLLRQPRLANVEDQPLGSNDDPADGMIESETVTRVRAAIAKLPEHYRSALVLCEYDQMPYAQIAETLGASIPQVKTWIHRARRQLAGTLKELAPPRTLQR